ncbi:MAG: hypothetical protein COX83_02790 [Candidatus Magasanikbacteria bacterium CG_4_10_14_0_2_um_filter_41_31]|uniref:Uncharacterized protein n=1 Tax=Candidatus Magasanikbacteria bacterium CG_4_10_14_0_2_um_filter_41_31 TaxID=1974639 RepID=A0A2M7V3L3_9BACT|nr:MAG: hypothetical protein COX83_02790 [Candidatus Magasanikbacteria bacterium CG_4_10_14_0_2_um_filter_41_31]
MLVKKAGSDSTYFVKAGKLSLVSGTLGAATASVQTVSDSVFATLEDSGSTVTSATILDTLANIGQGSSTPVVSGDVSVSLSANTPISSTYPKSTPAVPFLTVNLKAGSADASVSGFTVMRTGLGVNADLAKVWAEVDGVRKGSLRSVSSDSTANLTFGTSPITIAAGQTKTVIFYANLFTTAGASNALRLTAVTSGGTVIGLPVTGNLISVGSAAGPTTQYDSVTIASAVSIGDQDATVAKIKITNDNSSEDIAVKSIMFKSIAASNTKIDSNDLTDFDLFKGTTKVAGPVQMTSDGYVKFVLDNEVLIEKGGSKNETFTVKADVNEGPGREITLDVEYDSDVVVIGKNNGFRALVSDSSGTFTPTTVTIGATDLAISTDAINNPAARNVLKNTTQTLLKGYVDASKGEVDVAAFRVTLTGNDIDMGTTNEYDNLRVYVGGILVGEKTADDISTADSQTSSTLNFTDDFSVVGKKSLEVTIDVKNVTDSDWIYATISGSAGWTATRVSDGASVTPGGSATGNKVSINASALTLALSATPVSATRVKGATTDLMGFTMAAGTADKVTVNSLTFAVSSTLGVEDDSDLTNVYLYKQGVTAAIAGPVNLNSSEQIVFTGLNLTVAAGETDKYTLKGTLSASFNDATLSDLWVLASDIEAVSSQGDDIAAVTGVDSAVVNAAGTVKLTLVDRGTLDLALSSATPDSHMVIANSTGDVNAKVTLYAEYEAVTVKKLTFTTVAGSANDDDIARVRLYNGPTLIGDKPGVNAGVVTFNLAPPYLVIPADGSVTLDLSTDYNSTVGSVADTGALIQWSIADFNADIEADGQLNDVWAAVNTYNGTGVSLTTSTGTGLAEALDATETVITVTTSANFAEGDLVLIDDDNSNTYTSGDEYVLVLSISGNDITVRRGVGGVAADTATQGDNMFKVNQALATNTSVLYSNKPTLGYNSADQAAGTLAVGTAEVLKFTLSDSTAGEEDIKIEELLVRIDGTGMSTSSTIDWMISSASLYKDGKLVGTDADGLATSTGNLEFTSLDSDVDSVIEVGSVFTVVVTVANTIVAGDTMRATIDSFGSADVAGSISGGDLDWLDTEGGSAIEWVQTNLTEIKGGLYQKLS